MDSVTKILRNQYDNLYSAEKKVVDYILSYPKKVIMMNVSELAKESNVSDATVVRMCQHAGFKGYYQMRLLLSSDVGQNDAPKQMDSSKDPLGYIVEKEIQNIQNLETTVNKHRIAKAAKMISEATAVFVVAVGNTLPVANDLAFRLNRFGVRTFSTYVAEQTINYVNNAEKTDIIIAISKSGMAQRALQVCELGKKRGMNIIALTGDDTSPLAKMSKCVIYSGKSSSLFDHFIHGLETHVTESILIDALLYQLENNQKTKEKLKKSEEVELEVSSWKV